MSTTTVSCSSLDVLQKWTLSNTQTPIKITFIQYSNHNIEENYEQKLILYSIRRKHLQHEDETFFCNNEILYHKNVTMQWSMTYCNGICSRRWKKLSIIEAAEDRGDTRWLLDLIHIMSCQHVRLYIYVTQMVPVRCSCQSNALEMVYQEGVSL